MRRSRAVLAALVSLLLAPFAIYAADIPFLLDTNRLRQRLAVELENALGRDVKLGGLTVALFSGGLTGTQFEIGEDPLFSNGPFLSAAKVSARIAVRPFLFQKKLDIIGLELNAPQIRIAQDASGKWNFSSLGKRTKSTSTIEAAPTPQPKATGQKKPEDIPPRLAIKHVQVAGGQLELERESGKSILKNVYLLLENFGVSNTFPFTVTANVEGGGSVAATGVAGPLIDSDRARVPFQAKAKVIELNLLNSNAVSKETNLQGIVSFDGDILSASSGSVQTLKLQGTIEGKDFVFAQGGRPVHQTLLMNFQTDYDRDARSGTLNRGDVRAGNLSAFLTGSYELPKGSTVVHLNFRGAGMPLADLMGLLPALNLSLPKGSLFDGGTAMADLKIDGPLKNAVTSGPVQLTNTHLAGFDLGSQMKSLSSLTGIRVGPDTVFESAAAVVRVSAEGTRLEGIRAIANGIGELTGSGTVSPAHQLNFQMQAKIRPTVGLVRVIAGKGETMIPFTVQGTVEHPKFVADVKRAAAGIAAQRTNQMSNAARQAMDRLKPRK